MIEQNSIRFAIIGFGHIGKRHASMINNIPECSLVAICDPFQKEEIEKGIPFFNSPEELLASGIAIDVISLATPNGLHETQAIQCLKAGYHVVIEKPMALTSAGCEAIIKESNIRDKHIFCVMQNRFSPPIVWLKELLLAKTLGEIYMVQVNCFWNRDSRYYTGKTWHGTGDLDGGTLFTQFSHFIDILSLLFGDIKNISGKFKSFNHEGLTAFEDSGIVSFDFVNEGMGNLNYSTAIYNKNLESSITIIAKNGTVKIGGQYMDEVKTCDIKDYSMPQLPDNPMPAANHHFIFENVADVLKGRAMKAINPEEGMRVVEIIEKIYACK